MSLVLPFLTSQQPETTIQDTSVEMNDPLSEAENGPDKLFEKNSVGSFLWTGLNVKVKDRTSRNFKPILSGVNGMVKEGQVMAVMGPS